MKSFIKTVTLSSTATLVFYVVTTYSGKSINPHYLYNDNAFKQGWPFYFMTYYGTPALYDYSFLAGTLNIIIITSLVYAVFLLFSRISKKYHQAKSGAKK